jgi:hypothetical protein
LETPTIIEKNAVFKRENKSLYRNERIKK